MYMKIMATGIFLCLFLPFAGIGQTTNAALFSESSYAPAGQGVDPDNTFNRFVIVYKNSSDSNYRMKKVFLDSAYTQLLSKSFFQSGTPEGPFEMYAENRIILQGAYKNGKWDGDRKAYRNGVLVHKAHFTDGLRTGVWEEYGPQGQLRRRLTYSSSGALVSDVGY